MQQSPMLDIVIKPTSQVRPLKQKGRPAQGHSGFQLHSQDSNPGNPCWECPLPKTRPLMWVLEKQDLDNRQIFTNIVMRSRMIRKTHGFTSYLMVKMLEELLSLKMIYAGFFFFPLQKGSCWDSVITNKLSGIYPAGANTHTHPPLLNTHFTIPAWWGS